MAITRNHAERILSTKLCPPSESTRMMLVEYMTNSLSSESYFSKRYGLLSKEEAAEDGKKLEDIAFVAANHHASRYPKANGSSIAQLYAKEISKLMLEAVKRGPTPKTRYIVEVKETIFDISGEEQGFVDEPLARELLRPLEEVGNPYTKICFSNLSFGLEAAHVAKRVLMGVQKTLTDVDLRDFTFGRPEAEALEVMSIFSSALEGSMLRSLTLQLDALGEKGVRAFGPLLKSQKMLEELYFFQSNISREAANAICELLPSVERIKILFFHSSEIGDDAAEALSELVKKCISLERFRCSSSNLGTQGGIALAGALGKGSRLKILDFTNNMVGERGGVAFSQLIPRHLGLVEVYLSYLNLEDEGAIAIANSLKDAAPSLRVLHIAGNGITPKAAPALADCLALKNLLTNFDASDNELKDDGSVIICKALSEGHDQLRRLDLSTNIITGIGAKTAAEAVANKPDFSWLFIHSNFIAKKGYETVKDVLRKGTKGVSVLGGRAIEYPEEGSSDNDTELEEKLQNLKVRYGLKIFSAGFVRRVPSTNFPSFFQMFYLGFYCPFSY